MGSITALATRKPALFSQAVAGLRMTMAIPGSELEPLCTALKHYTRNQLPRSEVPEDLLAAIKGGSWSSEEVEGVITSVAILAAGSIAFGDGPRELLEDVARELGEGSTAIEPKRLEAIERLIAIFAHAYDRVRSSMHVRTILDISPGGSERMNGRPKTDDVASADEGSVLEAIRRRPRQTIIAVTSAFAVVSVVGLLMGRLVGRVLIAPDVGLGLVVLSMTLFGMAVISRARDSR